MPEGMIQPVSSSQQATGPELSLPNATGLHARPAAMLVALAKKFKSTVRLQRGSDEANAKSVVSILSLAAQHGDRLQVRAEGADASQAVAALSALLAEGCGEEPALQVTAPAAVAAAVSEALSSDHAFAGVCASPGLAVGRIVQYRRAAIQVRQESAEPELERGRLELALQQAIAQIGALRRGPVEAVQGGILQAHQELLQDPDLLQGAFQAIVQGQSAGVAWRAACGALAERFEAGPSALLRERANDIRDVGQRVLAVLEGSGPTPIELAPDSILVAQDLTPSDTLSLDRSRLLGFCTSTGGASSHVAILARSFGIPAICGIDVGALALEDGALVVLDGSAGRLNGKPDAAEVALARARMERLAANRTQEELESAAPACTRDGHRIEVVANVRNAQEAHQAVARGAEGVGLLRSEFLFEGRDTAPDEDEQAGAYLAVAQALGAQRTLVVRTLDVGGDKPLPYLVLPKEDNPFLGLRGVRVSLDQPQMFRTQLRAILRASGQARLHIMFPMIATVEELREAKEILLQEQTAAGCAPVSVGVMIEVPSAALMAPHLAREADFFSIGSNDLTQYTLAMDRGHAKLAAKADALHPAVLKMIALACDGAREHGKWVGVCGGLAAEPMAVPVLIGLGVSELSVPVPAVAAIKALVRRLSLTECQSLAREVLTLDGAAQVRARLAPWAVN